MGVLGTIRNLFFFSAGALCSLVSCLTLFHFFLFLKPQTYIQQEEKNTRQISSLINIGLLFTFILQHSLMKTKIYKRFFAEIPLLERCTYNLASSASLELLIYFWHPINVTIWNVSLDENLKFYVPYLYSFGWVVIISCALSFDILEFLGISQAISSLFNKELENNKSIKKQKIFSHSRHSGYFGFLIIFWSSTLFTFDRLILSLTFSGYFLFINRINSKDLTYVRSEIEKKKQKIRREKPVK